MAIDEMTKNVEKLDEIEAALTSAREELEVIFVFQPFNCFTILPSTNIL